MALQLQSVQGLEVLGILSVSWNWNTDPLNSVSFSYELQNIVGQIDHQAYVDWPNKMLMPQISIAQMKCQMNVRGYVAANPLEAVKYALFHQCKMGFEAVVGHQSSFKLQGYDVKAQVPLNDQILVRNLTDDGLKKFEEALLVQRLQFLVQLRLDVPNDAIERSWKADLETNVDRHFPL